jgi:uncharacterized protein YceH (UPF0502 family)
VEEILDMLAARGPEPLAARLERRPGERDTRFAHLLTGEVEEVPRDEQDTSASSPEDAAASRHSLEAEVAALRARLDRLERLLGVEDDDEPPSTERASGQVH